MVVGKLLSCVLPPPSGLGGLKVYNVTPTNPHWSALICRTAGSGVNAALVFVSKRLFGASRHDTYAYQIFFFYDNLYQGTQFSWFFRGRYWAILPRLFARPIKYKIFHHFWWKRSGMCKVSQLFGHVEALIKHVSFRGIIIIPSDPIGLHTGRCSSPN